MFGIFSALFGAFGFGTVNVVIKKSLESLSIAQTLMMTILTATGWLVLFLLASRTSLEFSVRDIFFAAGLALGEMALYVVLYKTFAVSQVTVATAVSGIYPIFSAMIAAAFFKEAISSAQWLAITILVVGGILTSVNWADLFSGAVKGAALVKGWPWILATTLIHVAYFPLLGQFTSTGSWESKLLLIKLFSIVILWLLYVVIRREQVLPPKGKVATTSLLGLLDMMGWVGFGLATSSNAGQTAIMIAVLNSSALVTAVWAYFVLNEKLSKPQYLGIGLIVAGLSWLSLG